MAAVSMGYWNGPSQDFVASYKIYKVWVFRHGAWVHVKYVSQSFMTAKRTDKKCPKAMKSNLEAISFLSLINGVGRTWENTTLGTFLLTKFSSSVSSGNCERVGSENDQSVIRFFNDMTLLLQNAFGNRLQVCGMGLRSEQGLEARVAQEAKRTQIVALKPPFKFWSKCLLIGTIGTLLKKARMYSKLLRKPFLNLCFIFYISKSSRLFNFLRFEAF